MKKSIFVFVLALCNLFSTTGQQNIITWPEIPESDIKGNDKLTFKVTDGIMQVNVNESGKHVFEVTVPGVSRDISGRTRVVIPVANTGNANCLVTARINEKKWAGGAVVIGPGESDVLEILFLHEVDKMNPSFPNMDGVPGGGLYIWDPVNTAELKSVSIEILTDEPASISFSTIYGDGNYYTPEQISSDPVFFPFIDQYGQFKHGNWPAKVTSDTTLTVRLQNEKKELAIFPGPGSFDRYGGWNDGPKLKATGNFYTEKVNGKWWLVDPEGNLFWSHGINCVGFGSGNTQTEGREKYFASIPEGARRYNFYTANLEKKFGSNWQEVCIDHIHNRLRSWGINTIANWSDPSVYYSEVKRTPYTANISYRCPSLDGASFKFPDVFDPVFEESLKAGVKKTLERTLNDSWCIGYFIDNELYLGNFNDFSNVVMMQKPEGYAKKALVDYLRNQYKDIRDLNKIYQTRYRSWDNLLTESALPQTAKKDILAFNRIIIEKYYSTCSKAIKEAAPQKLYMGNRFNLYRIYYPDDTLINYAIKTAAKYCDVVSINYYRFTCEDLVLPDGIDRPIVIGEFHFGALDRGLPHTGLRNTANQEQRAGFYKYYLLQALQNPLIVGTHWFQYGDQPYTGRSDGENYQIGFVDICDTPYPETIKAVRSIGYNLYQTRDRYNNK